MTDIENINRKVYGGSHLVFNEDHLNEVPRQIIWDLLKYITRQKSLQAQRGIKSKIREDIEPHSGDFEKMGFGAKFSDKVFVNPDVKEIYNIRTNCQVNCSPLHRFFSVDNFSVVEKEAKDLEKKFYSIMRGRLC